jgi:hypothetical protein
VRLGWAKTLGTIDVIVPSKGARRWHGEIIRRLRAAGHDVEGIEGPAEKSAAVLEAILVADARAFGVKDGLFARTSFEFYTGHGRKGIVLDLAGGAQPGLSPVLSLSFGNGPALADLAARIAAGDLPDLGVTLNGEVIAEARPMIDNRVSVARGLEDVLASAVTLIDATIGRILDGELPSRLDPPFQQGRQPGFLSSYVGGTLPRLGREFLRRQWFHSAHWRVGYRLINGPGVAETGDLSGASWSVLPDDGSRFYADPFPFEQQDRHFIFVEDFPHATGKGVISVSRLDERGWAGKPVPVLEEAYHLSYPQVFPHAGQLWMMPESSSGKCLVLYRAERFPDEWRPYRVLIEDRAISDATLLERNNRFFLFATDRDCSGSTSDRMVIYSADHFEGPYRPHPANPILIDRSRARPGGAFIASGNRLLLPVQDGTPGYGGGLGLSELKLLDGDRVELSRPDPIRADGFWPYPQIHTLNRTGRLEVIDGIAAVPKLYPTSSAS